MTQRTYKLEHEEERYIYAPFYEWSSKICKLQKEALVEISEHVQITQRDPIKIVQDPHAYAHLLHVTINIISSISLESTLNYNKLKSLDHVFEVAFRRLKYQVPPPEDKNEVERHIKSLQRMAPAIIDECTSSIQEEVAHIVAYLSRRLKNHLMKFDLSIHNKEVFQESLDFIIPAQENIFWQIMNAAQNEGWIDYNTKDEVIESWANQKLLHWKVVTPKLHAFVEFMIQHKIIREPKQQHSFTLKLFYWNEHLSLKSARKTLADVPRTSSHLHQLEINNILSPILDKPKNP